jgi:signal transduction histidine kinase
MIDSPPVSSRHRLFARFGVTGLIGFLAISVVLFQLGMRTLESHLVTETRETRAKYINAIISHKLTAEDFETVKKGAAWESFREKIEDLFALPEVVRVKIYNRHGTLIWSDSIALLELAPDARKNPELLQALEGHIEAEISQLGKDEHRFERGPYRSLMELYVPIRFNASAKVEGVAEIYLNVDPLFGTIRNSAWLMGLTIFGGLALLLLISFIGLGRAVTLIQKQNQDLRHALDEIFKANRTKDDLVSSLAHEFRNPDAVRSYAELLIDGAFGDQRNRINPSAEKMRNTAAELLSHFNRTLELTRLKLGDFATHKESLELTALIRNITSDLHFLCGGGEVAFEVEVPPDQVMIKSDRKLVQQVILNLVSNAIKFTTKGHIRTRLEDTRNGGGVKIVVEDTGIGIKHEEMPMIFDEFYRGGHSDARFKSGVGLGLAIVKRSLDLLHGKIQVESVYGEGSKFTVTLPRELN